MRRREQIATNTSYSKIESFLTDVDGVEAIAPWTIDFEMSNRDTMGFLLLDAGISTSLLANTHGNNPFRSTDEIHIVFNWRNQGTKR